MTQTDAAGNASLAGTKGFRKDTVAPTVVSATPEDGATVQPPATVSFDLLRAPRLRNRSRSTASPAPPRWTATTVVFTPSAPLPDGSFTAEATVTDAVGNPGSSVTSFTVDGIGPSIVGSGRD